MSNSIVTLLRHCESEYNVNPVDDISLLDCGLTSTGTEQAATLVGEFDLALVSPLRRCRETFERSNITAPSVEVCELVREHRVAICDFLSSEDPSVHESEETLIRRVEEFKSYLETLLPQYDRIVVVSHADFLFYFTSTIFENERFGKWLKNGEMLRWNTRECMVEYDSL